MRGSCQPTNSMQRTALYAAADAERQGHRNRDRGRGFRDRCTLPVGHEKLDFYRLSIGYVECVYEKAEGANGVQPPSGDPWLRGSQSIPLNIAEGRGKTAEADRRRYFQIARGSALECAAIQDVLVVGRALDREERRQCKTELDRMAGMFNRLDGRGYQVRAEQDVYGAGFDPHSDFDLEGKDEQPQPSVAG